jgi:hypothetical protein
MPNTSRGRGGVDLRTGTGGQHIQTDVTSTEIVDGVDQVLQIAPQAVELLHHQGIAQLERFQTGRQPRTRVFSPGVEIPINPFRIDAGRQQSIALQIQYLIAVTLGDPQVTQRQHGVVDAAR